MTYKEVSKTTVTKQKARKQRLLFVSVFALIILTAAVVLGIYKKEQLNLDSLKLALSNGMSWITDRKNHLKSDIEKVKQIATKPPAEPEIHFEFYTALQKMQVTPSLDKDDDVKQQPVTLAAPSKKTVAISNMFMKPAELEREFSKQLIQDKYIVQVGVFSHVEKAKQYKQILVDAGFTADIIKLDGAKPTYRVQVGPYADKEKASVSLQQLQKKGISGMIRSNL